jgi:hypothetical protein
MFLWTRYSFLQSEAYSYFFLTRGDLKQNQPYSMGNINNQNSDGSTVYTLKGRQGV